MVIAIFGRSSVGKSAVATILGAHLGVPVRHCGESVKEYARQHNRSASQLANADHQIIDDATRRIAATTDRLIIEGTFLDSVLTEVPGVILVRLLCSETERQLRFAGRGSGGDDAFRARDADDDMLRSRLYVESRNSPTPIDIDTSGLTADDVAHRIIEACNP